MAYYDPDAFPETYCSLIIKGCNIPPSVDYKEWWTVVGRKVTLNQVSSLRNDRLKELKWSYYCKCHIILLFMYHILTLLFLLAYRRYLMTLNPQPTPFTPQIVSNTMRSSYNIYKIFYQKFVSCIVGKRLFQTRLNSCTRESEIATVSDEALALLGFENAYPVWSDIWDKSDGKIRQVNKDEEIPECFKSEKHTLYTTKRDADGSVSQEKGKEWSPAGIEKFNSYRQKVRRDRLANKDFLPRFLAEWREANKNTPIPNYDSSMPDADDDFNDSTPANSPLKKAQGTVGVEEDSSVDGNEDASHNGQRSSDGEGEEGEEDEGEDELE